MAYVVVAAIAANAQGSFEIRGGVRDPSVNVGIQDVTITLSEVAVVDSQLKSTVLGVVATDAAGAFRFSLDHAGDFTVEAKKDGYVAGSYSSSEGLRGNRSVVPARLTRERTSEQIEFSFVRPGEVRGRVLDDKGKPLAKQMVTILAPQSTVPFPLRGMAVTDRDGFFVFPNLPPNSYVVRTGTPRTGGQAISPYSAEDFKTVDEDIEASYWPGATNDLAQASAIRLESGGRIELGDLTLRRVSYFRVHVSLLDPCVPGEMWRLALIQSGAKSQLWKSASLACSQDFVVRDVIAGSYLLTLSNEKYGAEALWALAPVTIAGRNVEVKMAVSAPGEIVGRLIPVQGGTLPPFRGLTVLSAPFPLALGGEIAKASVGAEGKFALRDLLWPERTIRLQGLGGSYYVREVRYNGAPVMSNAVLVARGATAEVEIVIDDQAPVLSGSVTIGEAPAAGATVLLQRWPVDANEMDGISWRFMFGDARADSGGNFRISGIAPGEYKVVAVPRSVAAAGVAPDVAARLLNDGQTVVLGRGDSKIVNLKLTESLQ